MEIKWIKFLKCDFIQLSRRSILFSDISHIIHKKSIQDVYPVLLISTDMAGRHGMRIKTQYKHWNFLLHKNLSK